MKHHIQFSPVFSSGSISSLLPERGGKLLSQRVEFNLHGAHWPEFLDSLSGCTLTLVEAQICGKHQVCKDNSVNKAWPIVEPFQSVSLMEHSKCTEHILILYQLQL